MPFPLYKVFIALVRLIDAPVDHGALLEAEGMRVAEFFKRVAPCALLANHIPAGLTLRKEQDHHQTLGWATDVGMEPFPRFSVESTYVRDRGEYILSLANAELGEVERQLILLLQMIIFTDLGRTWFAFPLECLRMGQALPRCNLTCCSVLECDS